MEQSPKTPPMNTSPTHQPSGHNKVKKSQFGKDIPKRPEGEPLVSNRSHANSPSSKSSSSSQSGEMYSTQQNQQEHPQIRNISNLSPYLIGRNFESFSGVMNLPPKTQDAKIKPKVETSESGD